MAVLNKIDYIENYNRVKEELKNIENRDFKIISVSKAQSIDALTNAYKSGIKVFGENYAQEITEKYESLPDDIKNDIEWHFIGHLQTNKVKYLAPFVSCIQTVYKEKLAKEINKRAEQNGRKIDVLVQVNTSGEDSKSGCNPDIAVELAKKVLQYDNINLKGFMTISGLESSDEERREQFRLLRKIRDKAEEELNIKLPELSMGMTSDYKLAYKEGATMLRIGTAIFGEREYN